MAGDGIAALSHKGRDIVDALGFEQCDLGGLGVFKTTQLGIHPPCSTSERTRNGCRLRNWWTPSKRLHQRHSLPSTGVKRGFVSALGAGHGIAGQSHRKHPVRGHLKGGGPGVAGGCTRRVVARHKVMEQQSHTRASAGHSTYRLHPLGSRGAPK
jgi:hypothetical protein